MKSCWNGAWKMDGEWRRWGVCLRDKLLDRWRNRPIDRVAIGNVRTEKEGCTDMRLVEGKERERSRNEVRGRGPI